MSQANAVPEQDLDRRRAIAAAGVAALQRDAALNGIEILSIGSLARWDFRIHSDIDLLALGPMPTERRVIIERLVAKHMRETGIPYDLMYEADLTPQAVADLLNDRG
ncbi:nucleotidyltransferase domain-containing protein [Rhizobium halophytocola]|uniref:Nucleotidyltransferase n=1 Tax=Rhizobium halophytocola TaxID=735519 RepID=A0ABS4E653_9HYPH|nr:nucleotidyltransferase domain-containing protein [Rhizobium halophytocola]MBP1853393.1 putative nucleotidyltransferase [Rhizobium halophytocola]